MSTASTSPQSMQAVFVDIEGSHYIATEILELERIANSDPSLAKVCFIDKATGEEKIVTISSFTYSALKDYMKHRNNPARGI